ncbi:DUF5954 family protein [Uniformispora flossi]|uniref:DUF5954 family protein n=1 Tax=Uniformispora flossi TaxID=3390723 RepID=UPI003C2F610D
MNIYGTGAIERRADASREHREATPPERPADSANASAGSGCFLRLDTFFGVLAEAPEDADRRDVMCGIMSETPQDARNSLVFRLWIAALQQRHDRAHRRRVKAGIRMLREGRANDLVVHGTRYRVVRADGYVRLDAPGRGEPPVDRHAAVTRPLDASGEGTVALDYPYFLDPALLKPSGPAPDRPVQARYPDAFFLPWGWRVVRRSGDGWIPIGLPCSTPRSAVLRCRPFQDVPMAEERLPAGHPVRAAYDEAVPVLDAAGRTYPAQMYGHTHVILPIRRLLRWGPDGPEPPRATDLDVPPPRRKLRL